MKLFGLTITRTSHYEHLAKEVSTLAIANVKLNKENAKYEKVCDEMVETSNELIKSYRDLLGRFSALNAKISLIECINDELQKKLRPNKAPRNPKLNRVSKCRRK